ncbi:MAG: LemA family protein, partial [Alphaproteobacteria bacterium]|nr:LemA family protein [Alphaproteobacteria bacterium]
PPREQGVTQGLLGAALGRLMAVAEGYPDLKANQNFIDLQGQLSETEEQIQLSRRYYNGAVRDLNILVESFPSNLIANAFKFASAEFFEMEDPADRAVPEVSFD